MALNKIPYKGDYQWFKSYFINKTDGVNNLKEYSLEKAIDVSMNYFFEEELEDNGMNRLVLFIDAFLYAIEHGATHPDFIHEVEQYIQDFETGEYDDLFTEKDLSFIREDIAIIKNYLSNHPEVLIDEQLQ